MSVCGWLVRAAAAVLTAPLEVFDTDGRKVTDAHVRRALVLVPYETEARRALVFEVDVPDDCAALQAEWDAATGDGLADAAEHAVQIMAAIIARHAVWAVNPERDGYICGSRTGCGLVFADLDAWSIHLAELVDAARVMPPAGADQTRAGGTGPSAPVPPTELAAPPN